MSDKITIENRGKSRVDIVVGEGNARQTIEFPPGERVDLTPEQAKAIGEAGENNAAIRALFEGDAHGPAQLARVEEQPAVPPPADSGESAPGGEVKTEDGAGAPQT